MSALFLTRLFSSSSSRSQVPTNKRQRSQPQSRKSTFETLDERRVMATTAVLDFGGGTISSQQMNDGGWTNVGAKTATSFRSLFTSSRPGLDMNADGAVNSTDADLAITRIVNKVKTHYAPYDIKIMIGGHDNYHSLMNDSDPGDAIVIVSGGTDFISPSDPAFGWGLVDPENTDDQYSFAFAREYYDSGFRGERFINALARTISHEMAHSFGLEHVQGNPHHLMCLPADRDFGHYFNFPDVTATTEDGGMQNAHQYLNKVLGASPNAWAAVLREGTLTLQGSANNDALVVQRRTDGTWDVTAGFGYYVDPDASPDLQSLNPYVGTAINSVVIYGGGGDDFIIAGGVQAAVMVYAYGGSGNDTIFGHDGRDYLAGDGGHDIILGLGGNDDLFGDAGRDILIGGDGADKLFGGWDNEDDVLLGVNSTVTNNLTKLMQLRTDWITSRSYNDRVAALNAIFATTTETNDGESDRLYGQGGNDMFLYDPTDLLDWIAPEYKRRVY